MSVQHLPSLNPLEEKKYFHMLSPFLQALVGPQKMLSKWTNRANSCLEYLNRLSQETE